MKRSIKTAMTALAAAAALAALVPAHAQAPKAMTPMLTWVTPATASNKPQTEAQAKEGQEKGRELPSPRIEIDGKEVGEVGVPGVSQVTRDEPLRPGQRIIVTGKVSDIIVKAAAGESVVEARFGPGELTGERTVIRIEAANGEPVITVAAPGDETVEPDEELVRPIE